MNYNDSFFGSTNNTFDMIVHICYTEITNQLVWTRLDLIRSSMCSLYYIFDNQKYSNSIYFPLKITLIN